MSLTQELFDAIDETLAEACALPEHWEARAARSDQTVEEVLAQDIIADAVEVVAKRYSNRFILVGERGRMYWTGAGFVSAEVGKYARQLQAFSSRKQARRAAEQVWRDRRIRVRPVGVPSPEPEGWEEEAYVTTVDLLRSSRQELATWEKIAEQRNLSVDEVAACSIADLIVAVVTMARAPQYVLMDASGTYYWDLNNKWVPIADVPLGSRTLQYFATRREAQEMASTVWLQEKLHLRIVRLR